ncbi:MAG: type III PLP-dependent enzyme, partial [Brevinematia bacterium]
TKLFNIGGPSCDSMDVIAKNVELPEPDIGDYVYILSAGAYTTVYAAKFNGYSIPEVIVL